MKNKITSFIILCFLLISQGAFCDENTQELDKGKSIFKRQKVKREKVKPVKEKRQYKIKKETQEKYSIPTNIYMNVGSESEKTKKLEGSIVKENTVLSLADCLELALINNPKIKAAYAKSEISKYQKWETLSGYSPRLDWSSSINRQKPDLSMLRNANISVSAFNKYTLGQIGIKQLVWDFGYTQNQYTINKIDYEKSKTEIDRTVNEVVSAVKDAYYNLMYAYNRKKVAQDSLDDYTTIFNQATAFWEVGTTTKVDVLFAQTNLENARAELIAANNNIDIAYSKLNNAIGLPFVDYYAIDNTINFEPVTITMKECVEIANTSRPDLKGAMLNVDMANQAVKLSWKTMMPKLEFQANWATGGISDWTDKTWYNAGGFLTFPTVNPLLLRNQIKEAKAAYEAMQYETKAQLNDIYYDIQNVYTRLKDASSRIPVASAAMERAKENYELASGRYKVGYGNVIELKDAQVALSSAKLAYYQTIYEYNSARASLERAIGQTIKSDEVKKIENFEEEKNSQTL